MGWGRRRTDRLSEIFDADRRRYAAAHPEIAAEAAARVAALTQEGQPPARPEPTTAAESEGEDPE